MRVIIGNNDSEVETKKISIELGWDIEINISINNSNELVINKCQFGSGESNIIIKPSVSNEIRIS